MYYSVGEDLAVNSWNELWIDLNVNDQHWKNTTVQAFSIHSSPNAVFVFDNLYCSSGPWNTFYYHCDYLGSPRVMTNSAGQATWTQNYYAFGGDRTPVATGNTHKFTGHIKDDATGQYYAKARYITTTSGRFNQPDPVLLTIPSSAQKCKPQLLNPYAYCLNNPLFFTDPSGATLDVAGDVDAAKKYLAQTAGADAGMLQYTETGPGTNVFNVTLSTKPTAEQLASNPGLATLSAMIDDQSPAMLFEAIRVKDDIGIRVACKNSPPTNLMTRWADPERAFGVFAGAYNSVLRMNPTGDWKNKSGQTVTTGVVYHELTELLIRSTTGIYNHASDGTGAHYQTMRLEKEFEASRGLPYSLEGGKGVYYVP